MVYSDKGYIGCFEMKDKESGRKQLLEYVRQLKNAGHNRIIAPINGDTWHQYRLMSRTDGSPAFPLEPHNPLWYNEVYTDIGFKPLEKYCSVAFPLGDIEEIPCNNDIIYKTFEPSDLKTIYDISVTGFVNNFLYEHINYEDFCKLYNPVLPMVDGDLVIIAYKNNTPCGFMFSLGFGDLFILKTIAVLPEYRKFGIGKTLMNKVIVNAQNKGFKTAIGALISEGNVSEDMVARYGAVKIREYTLYEYS
ncbi:MAG: GNAT family N-acetyltransferase [Oscillospiraceae bacterium]|nr:GNAT family N-acetyltransferase [Oscillospiraceae bacterium]